jgi:hypothetical protein
MLKLLRAIFGAPHSASEREHDRLVQAAIDKVVEGTDPRFAAIGGYRKKLREPVERSIEYVRGMTRTFREPLEVSRRAFASSHQVHAFFSSVGQLQEAFSLSQPVREFLATPDGRRLEHFYAGLAMQRDEKRVFTPQLVGEQVQHDVARTAVNFTEHRIVIPASTTEALHREFMERAFFTLVECALRRLAAVGVRKHELERARALLRAKRRALDSRALGMGPLASGVHASAQSVPAIEAELLATERELQSIAVSAGTLEGQLDRVVEVLSHPQQHVSLAWASSRVTPMGFVADANSAESAAEVAYMDIEIVGVRRFVGRFVRYPRADILPLERFRPVL